jgi:hypothetical protein
MIFKHLKKKFSKIKVIKYSLFYLFFTFVQNFQKKKRLVMTCGFECFQSQCHILKKPHEILCMMGAVIFFEENSFTFSFVSYGLVTKSFGVRCTFEEVAKKKENVKK